MNRDDSQQELSAQVLEPESRTSSSRPSGGGPNGPLKPRKFWGFTVEDELSGVFNLQEVTALMRYASERGIGSEDSEDGLLKDLYENIAKFREHHQVDQATAILADYTKLCKLTEPVTGRNVEAARNLLLETKAFMIITFLIFIICVLSFAIGGWLSNEPAPDEGYFGIPSEVVHYYLPFFTPFFWGALGSCVFILKKINDEAASLTFDPYQFKGWLTRALLGAILGGSITYIIDPEAFGTVGVTSTAIAFLAGLGTKAVYGGLEKIIELLVEKMNLDTLKRRKSASDAVAEFLSREVANTDPKREESKYKVLVELLQART